MTRRRRQAASIPAGTLIQLGDEADALFAKLKRVEARARQLGKYQRAAKQLRKKLSAAFGAASLAQTPQGRLIARFRNSRQLPALPAKELHWDEFQEMANWDA